jgi:ABC-type branched-subunit amino acid transport system substrate-binding protein
MSSFVARPGSLWLAPVLSVLGGVLSCGNAIQDEPIRVGLLLSYTGPLAASAVNSERALAMAIELANQAGGASGRPIRVIAQDTRGDTRKVDDPARQVLNREPAILIGPDWGDFLVHLRPILGDRTIILPSFGTRSDGWDKPPSWFLMGPSIPRIACELMAQVKADGRHSPLQIVSPGSYNGTLAYDLANAYSLPKHVVSREQGPASVAALTRALLNADAYLLLATPESASSLVYALTATGALSDPGRWYLSPTLHAPQFLESIPRGALKGARGVAPGTAAGAAEFRTRFAERWAEPPLDDAFAFYDAGAIAVLALEHALQEEAAIPPGSALAPHLVAVTRPGGDPVGWNEIGRGLQLLREGRPVQYIGLTGQHHFDGAGKTQAFITKWWSIGSEDFVDLPHASPCR